MNFNQFEIGVMAPTKQEEGSKIERDDCGEKCAF